MQNEGPAVSSFGLDSTGSPGARTVYWNLPPARLVEMAVQRGEAVLAAEGPLVCETGPHTGRSPNDKFVVKDPATDGDIWWGDVNKPFEREKFDALLARAREYVKGQGPLRLRRLCRRRPALPHQRPRDHRDAWHNLFARNMFIREEDPEVLARLRAQLHGDQRRQPPGRPGARRHPHRRPSSCSTWRKRMVLIGGTRYAGEIKKSIFSVMNYYLPKQGVLSMHCSANYRRTARKDDVALFFGLSGTGKTTLSADPDRTLIGDDEHGWSDDGVFNIEGGCYAKVIRLVRRGRAGDLRHHPHLRHGAGERRLRSARPAGSTSTTTGSPRTPARATRSPSSTTSTSAARPAIRSNVVFLTCDAFGVLPPISRLTEEQAMYHFLSGYTAKVAGTERGVTEPKVTFSTCFGSPFLPLHPGVYADMLGEKLKQHGAQVWLLNTGWTGGPYGVGQRMKLGYTRRMVTRRARRRARRRRDLDRPDLRPRRADAHRGRAGQAPPPPRDLAEPRRLRRPGHASSPTCSPRTSRSTRARSTRR